MNEEISTGLAQTVSAWEREHNAPAFVRQIDPIERPEFCPDCSGNGVVLISFATHGPSLSPYQIAGAKTRPCTWFEGNDEFGEGWYLIQSTEGYSCSTCNGTGRNPSYRPGPYVQRDIATNLKELVRDKEAVPVGA